MSVNGLSSLNAAYLSNIKNSVTLAPAQEIPKHAVQKEEGNKKLKNALIGLGITGALTALGVGIYCLSRGRGKNPKIASTPSSAPKVTSKTPDTSKLINTPIQTHVKKTPPLSNPPAPLTNSPETSKPYTIEKLGNGKIKVTKIKSNAAHTSVELPEYLYHFTSKDSMDKILSSGMLKISENEQLKGLYLLDSSNFLSRYGNTNINGENKDLLTSIFYQANRGNHGGLFLNLDLVVIKIPTEDLLQSGKLRIRTQEDFFAFTKKLKNIENKIGKKFKLRELQKDAKREELEKLVLSNGLMEKSEFEKFMRDMKIKIHHGYSISGAAAHNLENTHSIEYIFNHNVKLSDFPNIKTQTIKGINYFTNGKVDPDKVKTIFEGTFTPLTV